MLLFEKKKKKNLKDEALHVPRNADINQQKKSLFKSLD